MLMYQLGQRKKWTLFFSPQCKSELTVFTLFLSTLLDINLKHIRSGLCKGRGRSDLAYIVYIGDRFEPLVEPFLFPLNNTGV